MLTPPPGHALVVTADAIVGGVHFFPDDPPDAIAKKALRVNLSDLAAKGAKPAGFVLTLALPKGVGDDWLKAFRARARRRREDIRLSAARRRHRLHAGPGDDLDHGVRHGAEGHHGPAIGRAGGRPRHRHRHDRRRRARPQASQGARRGQALEARRSDAAPSAGALSRAAAAQRAGRSAAPARLRRDGRVRRPRRRSRQAVPRVRRRRRDRRGACAAVQGGAGCARRRSQGDRDHAHRRRRFRGGRDRSAAQTEVVPRGGAPRRRAGRPTSAASRPGRAPGSSAPDGRPLRFARTSFSHF